MADPFISRSIWPRRRASLLNAEQHRRLAALLRRGTAQQCEEQARYHEKLAAVVEQQEAAERRHRNVYTRLQQPPTAWLATRLFRDGMGQVLRKIAPLLRGAKSGRNTPSLEHLICRPMRRRGSMKLDAPLRLSLNPMSRGVRAAALLRYCSRLREALYLPAILRERTSGLSR